MLDSGPQKIRAAELAGPQTSLAEEDTKTKVNTIQFQEVICQNMTWENISRS